MKAEGRCDERQRGRRYGDDCNEIPGNRLSRDMDVIGHR